MSHFTVSRWFIALAGFGVVTLYGLWAYYGAAPRSFASGEGHIETRVDGAGHGGVHEGLSPMTSSEFRRLTEAFIAENRLADDSVKPRRSDAVPGEGHQSADHGAHGVEQTPAGDDTPVDIYLMAYQWGYTPAVLRLEPGIRYRFRIMAVDVAHGASLHLGPAARVVRLRPGQLVEQEIVFAREGEYLLYCTVYCGLNHDRMHGRIIVSKAGVPRHG